MKVIMNRRLSRMLLSIVLALAILLPALPQKATAQTTDGLIAWYKFDETAGATTFADSSGNNADAACAGDACPTMGVQGRIDQAAQFDGVDDKVTAALNGPGQPFALATWVYFSGTEWGGWRTIIEFGDDAPWFGVNEAGQLELFQVISGGSVPVQQWVHVAVVRSFLGSNILYINGEEVARNNNPVTSDGQGLTMGQEVGANSPWQGLIDDVHIFNRMISQGEVSQLAAGRTTVTLWHSYTGSEASALNQVITDFHASHPNVEILAEAVPANDLFTKYLAALAAGDPPHLLLGSSGWGPELADRAANGQEFEDLSSFASSDLLARIDPLALAAVQYQGKLLGLPHARSGIVLYRNTNIISEGVSTYQELVTAAQNAAQGEIVGAKLERGFFAAAAHL